MSAIQEKLFWKPADNDSRRPTDKAAKESKGKTVQHNAAELSDIREGVVAKSAAAPSFIFVVLPLFVLRFKKYLKRRLFFIEIIRKICYYNLQLRWEVVVILIPDRK